VPTNKQRREAARRHLERQLQRRQEREIARKRFTLIASIVGTLVLMGIVVGVVVFVSNDHSGKKDAGGNSPSNPTASSSVPVSTPAASPSTSARPAEGPSVTYKGVTVKGAADLGGKPGITSKSSTAPTKLAYKDLVVGKGATANPKSNVTIEYDGVLYKDGKEFDSSWARGQTAQFSLTGVVPGFTQGIGGTTGVPPMKVGGRRLMILPSALGYGAQANGNIPANSPLVFVVDLKKIDG
jgi:hypothetical protein